MVTVYRNNIIVKAAIWCLVLTTFTPNNFSINLAKTAINFNNNSLLSGTSMKGNSFMTNMVEPLPQWVTSLWIDKN